MKSSHDAMSTLRLLAMDRLDGNVPQTNHLLISRKRLRTALREDLLVHYQN